MESVGILIFVFFAILIASIIYGVTRASKYLTNLPKNLQTHFWTLAIWVAITFIQTMCLLFPSESPRIIEHFVVFAAGSAMIFSQHRLIRRQRGKSLPSHGLNYFRGLFLQTLWGPLSLGIVTFLLYQASYRVFWSAIAHRDISRISLLRTYGFDSGSEDDREKGLETVIRRQDSFGVVTYLEAGANARGSNIWWERTTPLCVSVKRESGFITGLLLRYNSDSGADTLVDAVTAGNTKQIRTLLTYRSTRKYTYDLLRDPDIHSRLIHIAYKHGDTKMIALLKASSGTP